MSDIASTSNQLGGSQLDSALANLVNQNGNTPGTHTKSNQNGSTSVSLNHDVNALDLAVRRSGVTRRQRASVEFNVLPETHRLRRSSTFHVRCQHCHHGTPLESRSRKQLILASIICVIFMIIEIVGGILSRSLAVITDGVHLLTDFSAFMLSFAALYLASRPASVRMNFGFYRAEVLGALLSVLFLWLLSGILCYMAVERIKTGEYEIDAEIMLIIAVCGIVINFIMFFILRGSTMHGFYSHEHNDAEEHDENINIRAAAIHVLGDLLQSFGVLTASLIIYFKPEYKIADPICTFIFSVIVLCTTVCIMKDVICILMEGVPKGVDVNQIRSALLNIPGVVKVYNLRVWALTLEKLAVSAHIAIERGGNALVTLRRATETIMDAVNAFELTLQIEEFCSSVIPCEQCERDGL